MTSENFEAEFVAYNEFRKLTGAREIGREEFVRTVERHNATLARRVLDDPAPGA